MFVKESNLIFDEFDAEFDSYFEKILQTNIFDYDTSYKLTVLNYVKKQADKFVHQEELIELFTEDIEHRLNVAFSSTPA